MVKLTDRKKELIELINTMRAESIDDIGYSAITINEYNGMVKEMQYHTGITAFNLDYLALKPREVCKHCGK